MTNIVPHLLWLTPSASKHYTVIGRLSWTWTKQVTSDKFSFRMLWIFMLCDETTVCQLDEPRYMKLSSFECCRALPFAALLWGSAMTPAGGGIDVDHTGSNRTLLMLARRTTLELQTKYLCLVNTQIETFQTLAVRGSRMFSARFQLPAGRCTVVAVYA